MVDTRERLIGCFGSVFPNLSSDEILLASNASVASWDSLATITLVSVIEEEFGVSIEPDEYELLISFEMILDCLNNKTTNA